MSALQTHNITLYIEHDSTFWFGWFSGLMYKLVEYILHDVMKKTSSLFDISYKIYTGTPIRKSSFIVFKSPIAFKKRGKEPYDKYKRITRIVITLAHSTPCSVVLPRFNLFTLRKFRYHSFIIKRVIIQSNVCMPLLFN